MYVGDPSQTRRDPLEPVAEHFQLQPATRLYMGYIVICGPKGYMVFQPFLVVNGVSNMDYARILSRHQLARVTREMSERSQHSLQEQFIHVVEPRKLNEAKKGRRKVNSFLFTVCLVPFFVVLSWFVRVEDFLLISVPVLYSGKNCAWSWKTYLMASETRIVGKLFGQTKYIWFIYIVKVPMK